MYILCIYIYTYIYIYNMFYERSRKSWRRFDQLLLRNSDWDIWNVAHKLFPSRTASSLMFLMGSATGFSHGDDLKKPWMILPGNLTQTQRRIWVGHFLHAPVPLFINASVVIDHILSWFILISPQMTGVCHGISQLGSEVNQTYGCEALKPGGWAQKPGFQPWISSPFPMKLNPQGRSWVAWWPHTRVTWWTEKILERYKVVPHS